MNATHGLIVGGVAATRVNAVASVCRHSVYSRMAALIFDDAERGQGVTADLEQNRSAPPNHCCARSGGDAREPPAGRMTVQAWPSTG